MTIARLRSGEQNIPSNNWAKLGTVCARAKQVMDHLAAARGSQGNDAGPPAALLKEVMNHLTAVAEHADKATAGLLSSVASGEAKWCANERIYQEALKLPTQRTDEFTRVNKGQKGKRKQRRRHLKQDL